jgi:hypothetical protein
MNLCSFTEGKVVKSLATLVVLVVLSACGALKSGKQSAVESPSNPVSPPVTVPVVTSAPYLTYDQVARFEYSCAQRDQQLRLLQAQLKNRPFFTVDGVMGNELPNEISKKFYALVKYRIWSLRLGCSGSRVMKSEEPRSSQGLPSRPPELIARCYFEEVSEIKTDAVSTQNPTQGLKNTRREICTNYPLANDGRVIEIGDVVDLEQHMDKKIPFIPNLRKWDGKIFQLVSKLEMHRKEYVRFTVVLMWDGNKFVVVDKF